MIRLRFARTAKRERKRGSLAFMKLMFTASMLNLVATSAAGAADLGSVVDRQARTNELAASLGRSAQNILKELNNAQAHPTVRDLGNTALFLCLTKGDTAKIEQLIRTEFSAQVMDQSSAAFGQMPWTVGDAGINDLNAMEFGCQPIGPILIGYGNHLSPQLKQWLRPHIDAVLAAMRKHKVPVTYTNIYLMKAVDFILLGTAIDDQSALYEGVEQLDKWIAYTKSAGIHEFDSPTYYACDLNSLLMGYLFSPDKVIASKFKIILDYFWQDIAANYFAPTQTLSGAHSRDYDFLSGAGGIDVFTYLSGLRDLPLPDQVDLEKVYPLLNETTAQGYHASAHFLELAKGLPREVLSRWDDYPTKDRTNYICKDYSLSTANGGDYSPQDKLIAMQFASSKRLPTISVVLDRYNSPYGKFKTKDKSGHEKPRHEELSPTILQNKSTVLALFDIDASRLKSFDWLVTNLILPAKADAIIGSGMPYDATPGSQFNITAKPTIGVYEGQTGFSVRVFRADAVAGSKVDMLLMADSEGLKDGACRLAIYHAREKQINVRDKHIKVGLLLAAKHCNNAQEFREFVDRVDGASIEEIVDEKIWKVQAKLGDLTLECARDLSQRRDLYRRTNGIDALAPVFSVNGALLGPSLWNSEDVLLQKQ